MTRCTPSSYSAARRAVRDLGYPPGSPKHEMYWHGFRTAARDGTPEDCPIPDITPEQRAEGRRTPHRRTAWLNGFTQGGGACP